MLLVDSETPVCPQHEKDGVFMPWEHLKNSDKNWNKPPQASDKDCHLMVQCMENWLLADWEAVGQFFGQDFKSNAKPSKPIEKISKQDANDVLKKATKDCAKGKYGKGTHSFKLLALISPALLLQASPWAKRFIEEVAQRKPIA